MLPTDAQKTETVRSALAFTGSEDGWLRVAGTRAARRGTKFDPFPAYLHYLDFVSGSASGKQRSAPTHRNLGCGSAADFAPRSEILVN